MVVPSNRIVAPPDPAGGLFGSSVLQGGTLVEQLREMLEREGILASCSADQEGIFVAVEGADEVSVRYNLLEDEAASPTSASFRKARNDLVRFCSVIAGLGFAVTLILSPRTLALFVTSEGESKPLKRSQKAHRQEIQFCKNG